MIIIEKYRRQVNDHKRDTYRVFLRQLYKIDYIMSQTYKMNEYEELLEEIHSKISEFNRNYGTNVDLLIPHFNNWYIQVLQKYNDLVSGMSDGDEN